MEPSGEGFRSLGVTGEPCFAGRVFGGMSQLEAKPVQNAAGFWEGHLVKGLLGLLGALTGSGKIV